ncbi:hypothetical protein AWB79_00837 [Caballeronia hypogeia]|uniref:Uncharacterized protein n=1 Tax=Caballeronia hypogeia TaxID=1777140 RepID=A0A157ZGA3_9BURK|nr:hypothetical protein [Caballeronia hypogeia]SAK44523.1 hypothetical protein AWB79_00837 [Caballeronia hypogeia]
MNETWQYQIRIKLAPEHAAMARADPSNAMLAPLNAVLEKHNARVKCQYDAFADYVAQAEHDGVEHYPLYRWTRDTIENPVKKARYLESFTLYVNDEEVYEKALADALETDLRKLASEAIIDIRKYDTNPASNPQPPSHG